jgi:adenosylcobinamide-GDP ribazoletransferase
MHDGRLGAFGAIGLVLFLLLEVAALVELPADARRRALLVVPAVARATPPLLARYFPPARAEGHGATFREGLRAGAAPLVLTLGVAVAVAALGVVGLALAVVSVVAALALAAFMMGRLAGVTGDVLGAAIEVAELAGLLTVAAWAHVRP